MKAERFFSDDPFELLCLLEEMKREGVGDECVEVGMSRAREVLFRDIRSRNPTGEGYYPGDDLVVKNKSKAVGLWARILVLLTTRLYYIPDGDLVSLFTLLKSEDDLERECISQAIRNLYKANPKKILELLGNEFQLFFLKERTHIGMDNVLDIYSTTTKGRDIPEEEYFENILLFMKTPHLDLYSEYKDVVLGLCRDDPKRTHLTLQYILHIFEDLQSLSRVYLVEILTSLLKNVDFKDLVPGISSLINSSLLSSHHLLLEEAIGMFEVPEIYKGMKESVGEFLPRIFDSLYSLSKKYWRKKGKVKLFRNISLVLSMNHEVFEKCLVAYNKLRYRRVKMDEKENLIEKCLEYSELEKRNEEKFNKRRKSTNQPHERY